MNQYELRELIEERQKDIRRESERQKLINIATRKRRYRKPSVSKNPTI